jgi:hypothetical protein
VTLDESRFQECILQVGVAILKDSEYMSNDWDEIALVITLETSGEQMTGYIYQGDLWKPRIPDDEADNLYDLCKDLQKITRSPTGETWKQALIHVTKPGPEINVQFEYEDATRWSLKKVSLDLKDYAMSLRPPRTE